MPYVIVEDIKLYYELHGENHRETVVFLHGLGSSHRDWALQIAHFAKKYRVVVLDCRGHGNSDKPAPPYSIKGFAKDVISVLDHLNLKRVHVVGLSMGGMIAFQMAVDFPQYVRTLTIANSSPSVVPKTLRERFTVWSRFLIVRVLGMRKMGEVLAKKLFIDADQADIRQLFIERWAENDTQAYLAAMRAIVGWSVEDEIGKIKQPTLVIASDDDYTPISEKAAYVSKMQMATLQIVEDARHAVSVERPEAFNELISRFFLTVQKEIISVSPATAAAGNSSSG